MHTTKHQEQKSLSKQCKIQRRITNKKSYYSLECKKENQQVKKSEKIYLEDDYIS
jgi:hypothetical protein